LILRISILFICYLDPKHLNTGKGKIMKKISRSPMTAISTYSISLVTNKRFYSYFRNSMPLSIITTRITKNYNKKAAIFKYVYTNNTFFSSRVTSFFKRNSDFGTFVSLLSIFSRRLIFYGDFSSRILTDALRYCLDVNWSWVGPYFDVTGTSTYT
jgi:hypothetical protein